MKGGGAFLAGIIAGMILMFGLVHQGYVRVAQLPAPGPTAGAALTPSPVPELTPAATPAATATQAAASPGATEGSPAALSGQSYVWTGEQATITYAFHADGSYDATYVGTENGARVVGVSKGTYTLSGDQVSTHESSGSTRRTVNGATTTRAQGAGDVTFTVAEGELRDTKGRTFAPIR